MLKRLKTKGKSSIPAQLSEDEFDEFILKHLLEKVQKHHYQVSRYKIFNYILKFLYTGCQWKMLPIDKDENSCPEIHYSQVFLVFKQWLHGDAIFEERFNKVERVFAWEDKFKRLLSRFELIIIILGSNFFTR